jgi:hypothetical protein
LDVGRRPADSPTCRPPSSSAAFTVFDVQGARVALCID